MKHCKSVIDEGIKTFQFDALFTEDVEGATRVYNWDEVYDLINS